MNVVYVPGTRWNQLSTGPLVRRSDCVATCAGVSLLRLWLFCSAPPRHSERKRRLRFGTSTMMWANSRRSWIPLAAWCASTTPWQHRENPALDLGT